MLLLHNLIPFLKLVFSPGTIRVALSWAHRLVGFHRASKEKIEEIRYYYKSLKGLLLYLLFQIPQAEACV